MLSFTIFSHFLTQCFMLQYFESTEEIEALVAALDQVVPCVRLSWPSCQILTPRKYTVWYIV